MQSKVITTNIGGDRTSLPKNGILSPDQLTKDQLVTQSGWNPDRWADTNLLMGYQGGFPAAVTYFNQNQPRNDIRSNPIDVSLGVEHAVHQSYTQINNLEIRLDAQFEYTFNDEENRYEASCQFTTPTGFIPILGDLFYYYVQDGKIALMAIVKMEPLSMSRAAYMHCTGEMIAFLTTEQQDYIQQKVVDVVYFDKQKYLTGSMSLLTSQSWVDLNTCQQLRLEMITWFGMNYWDELLGTFVRPDQIYDPYLVAYWHKKVSTVDFYKRPIQILPTLHTYLQSFWSLLTETNRSNDPNTVIPTFVPQVQGYHYWSPGITPLINRTFLALDNTSLSDNEAYPYIFSLAFYQKDTTKMTAIERLVFNNLMGSQDNAANLAHATSYRSWSKEEAFYQIPIAIWLMDRIYSSIR